MTSVSPAYPRPSQTLVRPPSSTSLPHKKPYLSTPLVSSDQPLSGSTAHGNAVESDARPVKKRRLDYPPSHNSTNGLGLDSEAKQQDGTDIAGAKLLRAPWASVVFSASRELDSKQPTDSLPPLPLRPWGAEPLKSLVHGDVRSTSRVRADVAVPMSPTSMEPPEEAPRYERKKRADYFPWTGKHPEDVLSDAHVKQGYCDRAPQPAEKELNTAKAPLYNAFKHRSGMDTLSALFSLVLEQKTKTGALTSTSTFKPPPRVTLTEAKRKSWISDLANSDVPLRRLTRTIPQGIRGQPLLEQCLVNSVPLARAVWFAKCVGANEIRTLKRKGVNPNIMSGLETKWLRDWTTSIEKFIGTVLGQCGKPSWQEQIQYTFRLCTRLYLDNMLDRDQYLDWIVKEFSEASLNQLPFWLMLVHVHKADLVRFRKRASYMASVLVLKYLDARGTASKVSPLASKLQQIIRSLAISRPACFLIPEKWRACEKALKTCLDTQRPQERLILNHLQSLNQQVMGVDEQTHLAKPSPQERVVQVLDAVQAPFDIPGLSDELFQACSEPRLRLLTCMQWCTSKFRTKRGRVYLIARLLRRWRKSLAEIDSAILEFSTSRFDMSSLNISAFKQLMAELSRSNTFSVSRYLQRLSVRGFPKGITFQDSSEQFTFYKIGMPKSASPQKCNDATQLLTELCFLNSDDHVLNWRNALLSRTGFDEDRESILVADSKTFVQQCLKELDHSSQNLSMDVTSTRTDFSLLSWSARLELSKWLRAEVAVYASASHIDIPGKPPLPGARSFSLAHFTFIRNILEQLEEIAILADVLSILSITKQEVVLAAIVDTINYHSESLSAIGALESLQITYCQTYLSLRSSRPSVLLLASSLIEFCQQYPNKLTPVRALEQDFIRGDRGRAVAACSPFSDGVAESLQQAGATFIDDFEAILQTETNMNEQTTMRLFGVLVQRIEKAQHAEEEDHHSLFTMCQLLSRLKLCQKAQGELLFKKWLAKMLLNNLRLPNVTLIFELVNTRCVSLETIVDICHNSHAGSNTRNMLNKLITLPFATSLEEFADVQTAYRFKLGLKQLVLSRPVELLDLLGTSQPQSIPMAEMWSQVLFSIITDPEKLRLLPKPMLSSLPRIVDRAIVGVESTQPLDISHMVEQADPFSLPFCQFRLRVFCQQATTTGDQQTIDNIADILLAASESQGMINQSYPSTVQNLVQAVGSDVGGRVRQRADLTFFERLPRFLQTKGNGLPPMPTEEEGRAMASSIQKVLLLGGIGTPSSTSLNLLVEKLTLYTKYLNGKLDVGVGTTPTSNPIGSTNAIANASNAGTPSADEQYRSFLLASLSSLDALLQMVCVKRPAFSVLPNSQTAASLKPLQQEQIKILALVVVIATSPALNNLYVGSVNLEEQQTIRKVISFAHDVAATLVDDLAEDSRQHCIKVLKEKVKDERVQWLLGSVNMCGSVLSQDVGQGLQVVHDTRGTLGEWKPKVWDLLESGGNGGSNRDNDTCLGLGLFGARQI